MWLRIVLAGTFSVAAILLTISVSAAELLARANPALALRMAPFSASAIAAAAELRLGSGTGRSGLEDAIAVARDALRRDPTVRSAWRTLGVAAAAEGRASEATQMFLFANRLSRRDLPTQLWLIEDNVRRNDVDGALVHYDYALRTSRTAADLLLPVLVNATSTEVIIDPLSDLLAADPPWAPSFFFVLGQTARSGEGAADIIAAVREKGYSEPIPNAWGLPGRLVQQGDYASASRLYESLQEGDTRISAREDQFAKSPKLVPFDWDLQASNDVRAEPQLLDSSDTSAALYVYAANGTFSRAARKLVLLRPGRYRLLSNLRVDQEPFPDRLEWTISCAGAASSLVTQSIELSRPGRTTHSQAFVVPSGNCEAQWLDLSIRGSDGPQPAELWVEDVEVEGATGPAQPPQL